MQHRLSLRSRSARRAAFTLAEILIATTITAMLGAATLTMLIGLHAGADYEQAVRRESTAEHAAAMRIAAATRNASALLAHDPDHLVLWTGDANNNAEPELSELRRIQWDEANGELRVYELTTPSGAPDPSYSVDDHFSTITANYAGTALLPGRVLLRRVNTWHVAIDASSPSDARRLRITVHLDGHPDPLHVVTALRAETP